MLVERNSYKENQQICFYFLQTCRAYRTLAFTRLSLQSRPNNSFITLSILRMSSFLSYHDKIDPTILRDLKVNVLPKFEYNVRTAVSFGSAKLPVDRLIKAAIKYFFWKAQEFPPFRWLTTQAEVKKPVSRKHFEFRKSYFKELKFTMLFLYLGSNLFAAPKRNAWNSSVFLRNLFFSISLLIFSKKKMENNTFI